MTIALFFTFAIFSWTTSNTCFGEMNRVTENQQSLVLDAPLVITKTARTGSTWLLATIDKLNYWCPLTYELGLDKEVWNSDDNKKIMKKLSKEVSAAVMCKSDKSRAMSYGGFSINIKSYNKKLQNTIVQELQKYPAPHVISLTRRNYIAQAVSNLKAYYVGKFLNMSSAHHAENNPDVINISFPLDPKELMSVAIKEKDRAMATKNISRALFGDFSSFYCELTYEDMLEAGKLKLPNSIVEYFGVNSSMLDDLNDKVNPHHECLRSTISNFDEVSAYLKLHLHHVELEMLWHGCPHSHNNSFLTFGAYLA